MTGSRVEGRGSKSGSRGVDKSSHRSCFKQFAAEDKVATAGREGRHLAPLFPAFPLSAFRFSNLRTRIRFLATAAGRCSRATRAASSAKRDCFTAAQSSNPQAQSTASINADNGGKASSKTNAPIVNRKNRKHCSHL